MVELYEAHFERLMNMGPEVGLGTVVCTTDLRDFWLERNYTDDWLQWALSIPRRPGAIKETLLHKRGDQAALRRLAEDILNRRVPDGQWVDKRKRQMLIRSLELDGYRFEDGRLRQTEEHVFQVEETRGVLRELYRASGLPAYEQVDHDLKGSEDHYSNEIWGDSIKRVRDALETTLLQVARALTDETRVPNGARPADVRVVLRDSNFLNEHEYQFIRHMYALISEQGGHPNLAARENALLCRQHVLTAIHFVLLRYQGLKPSVQPGTSDS